MDSRIGEVKKAKQMKAIKHQKAIDAVHRELFLREAVSACSSAMLDSIDYSQSFVSPAHHTTSRQANHTPNQCQRAHHMVKQRSKATRHHPRAHNHHGHVVDVTRELSMRSDVTIGCHGDNLIGAHDISDITNAYSPRDSSSVGAVCSTMLHDVDELSMTSEYRDSTLYMEHFIRPQPEGSIGDDADKPTPTNSTLSDRSSFTNITLLSDPPVPANSPNSSFSDDAVAMDTTNIRSDSFLGQLGPRPACIGQDSDDTDSDLLTMSGSSSGYSSASGSLRCHDKDIPSHGDASVNMYPVYENVAVRRDHSRHHRRAQRRAADNTMCSDMTDFMAKPLCRQGVAKETKMSHKQKKSIAHKLKKFGKKIHGISSSSSIQTLAVL